jgi:PIN domain nuclease of toxin-antitoxin system
LLISRSFPEDIADAFGRYPFDRMLVAQAVLEDAVIVSSDERLGEYEVRVAW